MTTRGWKSKEQPDVTVRTNEQQDLPVSYRKKSSDFLRIGVLRKIRYRFDHISDRLGDVLLHNIAEELERGLAFKLLPVAIGAGILVYFSLPIEPVTGVVIFSFIIAFFITSKMKSRAIMFHLCAVFACLFAGVIAVSVSSYRHQGPVLERQITSKISGVVLAVQQNRRGSPRYLIKPVSIEKLPESALPVRLRLSAASRHKPFEPGDKISGVARMQPVSGPAYPGSYNFFFHSRFKGLGGSGFFMGAPAETSFPIELSVREAIQVTLNQTRLVIEKRIKTSLPGSNGDIAVALLTGNKTHIDEATQESLRNTGLAHVLAISGLHMGLVALTMIGLLRLLFAFSPKLSQRYPIRKWATGAGFIAATGYLFLSGAGVATQRAWIMISIMLIAVMLDRRAITMRGVALSAIIILLISPQSIFSPGFHMSFAAVAALVAGYEMISRRKFQSGQNRIVSQNIFVRSAGLFARYFSGLALTSLIAGTATGFFAAWHFHRVAMLGLLANVLAMPFAGLIVMPMGLISIVLMPYGLDFIPLAVMGWGIDQMVGIAMWVDKISEMGGTGIISQQSLWLFITGLVILTLFSTRLRWIGIIPITMIPIFWQESRVPDILVSENGRSIAVGKGNDGLLLLYPKRNKFVSDIWTGAWGEVAKDNTNKLADCGTERCTAITNHGLKLQVIYNPELLKSSCREADILVAPRLWWVNCRESKRPKLILKRHDFEQFGTHAIYLNTSEESGELDIQINRALKNTGRPWQRSVRPVRTLSDIAGLNRRVSPEP